MIPPELQDFETYVVAYSGGKDSTAMALGCLAHLPRDRLRFVFNDTGACWPETYAYLNYIEKKLDIEIERVRAGDRPLPAGSKGRMTWAKQSTNLYDMIKAKGQWPSVKIRWCTKYLKMWPLRLYAPPNSILLFGDRAEESRRRAAYEQFDVLGNNFHEQPIYRPILDWSEDTVWQYLSSHDILPNPVYNYAPRANCWCCPMARPQALFNFCRQYPGEAQRWANLEVEINHRWHERLSIGNILEQARRQLPLFEPEPRFPECYDPDLNVSEP